ncbi:tetratricopeptide repeat protein [Reichenbachiella ulvae]|uniref:Tetratricopeptide repeat protein n=1 Tax=Reichenbachiella ulvae TaxID=2980104 RepID=A0ABT3CWT0_9BACT|nr:tetratricopeptide repeat protein [Reichenbachiella ulvae]MCV9388160.1 tetratricopeptide repeat protein [Reichenbachiella ulvae]
MKKLLLIGLVVGLNAAAIAQPGWNWPEDVDKAKEKNALYVDAVKSEQYATAVEPHKWLLENCPDLNESLYINGIKIYEGLADEEKDAAKQLEYQEMAMKMYDDRIKYFGDEANVLNRKAFSAYKYYKGNKAKYQEMMDLFKKVFELNGTEVLNNNLVGYMDVVRRYKLTGGAITDEEVIEIYGMVSDIIAEKQAKSGNDKYEKYQENVDKLLTATVDVNCEFIEGKLVPKMRETQDVKMAKKVFQLMLSAKCTDSPAFAEAGELVYTTDPSYGMAKVLGIKFAAAGDMDKATKYYDAAIDMSDDNLKKAEIYMNKAQMYASKGMKPSARSAARMALANDPSAKEAYTLIGNLYFQSYNDCREGVSKVDDRLVFIAAYNQYAKAGNSELMAKAKEQFPSIGEIFELGLTEGQSMTLGCWINETVVLERRPN